MMIEIAESCRDGVERSVEIDPVAKTVTFKGLPEVMSSRVFSQRVLSLKIPANVPSLRITTAVETYQFRSICRELIDDFNENSDPDFPEWDRDLEDDLLRILWGDAELKRTRD